MRIDSVIGKPVYISKYMGRISEEFCKLIIK